MPSRQAPQACVPCRKLKRKCPRELPACSLCIHLDKTCEYPQSRRGRSTTDLRFVQKLEQRSTENGLPKPNSISVSSREQANNFPATFFIDSENYQPISAPLSMPVPTEVLDALESSTTMHTICNNYWSSTQIWLPMLSRKRIAEKLIHFNTSTDAALALLLLAMKLTNLGHQDGVLYCLSKGFYARVEAASIVSLQVLQAGILIAVYELGHAIFPAAYLSISHAARLGIILGLHDRKNATQMYREPDTWTEREEERRTWWGVVVLDRYINLGTRGSPLSTPDPLQGTLLPTAESSWDSGEIGSNQPLFATSFTPTTQIGSFASACQSSHILGLALRHRNTSCTDTRLRLLEALQLHRTLVSLSNHLSENPGHVLARALCYSARLVLYGLYGCNEHFEFSEARVSEETEMQSVSLAGLREVSHSVYELAASELGVENVSPLLCQCLYLAASELGWFLREGGSSENITCLSNVVGLLRHTEKKWRVAGEYIRMLEAEGSLVGIA